MKSLLRLLLIGSFALQLPVCAEDWPSYRGPNRNGITNAPFTPVDEPEQIWRVKIGMGRGSMSISDGKIYVHGRTPDNSMNRIRCLEVESGEQIWEYRMWPSYATPTVADGHVYTRDHARVYAFKADSGELLWEKHIEKVYANGHQGHSGSPLIFEDLVIVNLMKGVALKRDTGEVVWEFGGISGQATPVLFQHQGKPAVAIFSKEELVARDIRTGAELWAIPWKTTHSNSADPLFFDGKVLVSSAYGKGRTLFDLSSGRPREIWAKDEGSAHAFASWIYHDGRLFGSAANSTVCVDPATGEEVWQEPTWRSLILIDKHFIGLTQKGEISVFPPSSAGYEPESIAQVHRGETFNTRFIGKEGCSCAITRRVSLSA